VRLAVADPQTTDFALSVRTSDLFDAIKKFEDQDEAMRRLGERFFEICMKPEALGTRLALDAVWGVEVKL
jgi:hypothetical protein